MSPRYAPAIPLLPYAYVPGHDLPHPVTDSRGHSYRAHEASHRVATPPAALAQLPTDPASRRGVPGELLERLVGSATTLGLAPDSLAAVVTELEELEPACWHASRARVVRVVTSALRLAE